MTKREKLQKIIDEGVRDVLQLSESMYRVGYCAQCGECCKIINIRTSLDEVVKSWLELHGIRVTMIDQTSGVLTWDKPCKKLVESDLNPGTYTCTMYEERPIMCQSYPKTPSMHKTCMYVFINKKELEWFLNQFKEDNNGSK